MIIEMEPSLEIRKLQPSYMRELAEILEYAESWKRLMSLIPKTLDRSSYKCDLQIDNVPKYKSEHFKLIENASLKCNKTCTEILFDEWGTSGKIRPTLGHLKYLLSKAELFRAADYVAVKLLHEEVPSRPSSGPAALVTIDLSKIIKQNTETANLGDVERHLDEINYPQSAINAMLQQNKGKHQESSSGVPKIVVSEVHDTPPAVNIDVPVVQMSKHVHNVEEVSDMMKFSHTIATDEAPELSFLLNQSNSKVSSKSATDHDSSEQTFSRNESSSAIETEDNVIPNISNLLPSKILSNQEQSDSINIPALSALNPASTVDIEFNQVQSALSSGVIPCFDMLQSKDENSQSIGSSPTSKSSVLNSNSSYNSSAKCSSPLPNLSLNTQLPHFTYSELTIATNNFSEEPYTSENEQGRWLGAGAFGSVFLAIGLTDKPLAVKSLFLNNTDSVSEDHPVTKQFRNEVEVLSKYKHENLVSLVGYSCDGCTYCLVYEYVSGGSLTDKLQNSTRELTWKDRLKIALGTAKAISYLHTAFSTSLIHRDVKSANILLDSENNAKLCDFGLIKLLPNHKTNTHTSAYGTSAYMSLEAHRGDISVKLDTFSYGVVLLELLTSLPPFADNRDIVTYMEDTCEDSISPLLDTTAGSWEENNINYAEKVFEIVQQCLQEKKKRPKMVDVTNTLIALLKDVL